MTKPELIKAIAAEWGFSQMDVKRVIESALRLITEALEMDGRIEIGGFGVFKVVERAGRNYPNPQDRSKMVDVPARNTVTFKPSPALKEAVQ